MAPIIRRSGSSGISKPPQRKSSKTSRENSIDGTGVGLITSILRAGADSALQNSRSSFDSQHAVKAPTMNGATTNGVDGPLHSLSTMADRVGKEVEEFAEKVDKWRSKIMKTPHDEKARFKATMALAEQLEKLADSRLSRAKRNAPSSHGLSISKTRSENQNAPTPREAQAQVKDAQNEVNTWRLFRIMLESEFHDPGHDRRGTVDYYVKQRGPFNDQTTGSEVWERFVLTSDVAREQKRVLEWLEETARADGRDLDTILQDMDAQSGYSASSWSRGWQATRERLKAEKRVRLFDTPMEEGDTSTDGLDTSTTFVTQLDPDAPSRQSSKLVKGDADQEELVWKAAFQMLRCGLPISDLRSWFEDRGETWRAVSFGIANDNQTERTNLAGQDCGSLWRRLCYGISQSKDVPTSQAALYGLLGGNPDHHSDTRHSWDDILYTKYNALLLGHFQQYLEQELSSRDVAAGKDALPNPAVLELLGEGRAGRNIIDSMHQQEGIAPEAKTPPKLLQGALLSQQLMDLSAQVGYTASQNPYTQTEGSDATGLGSLSTPSYVGSIAEDETSLRLLVHLAIIIQTLQPEQADNGHKYFLDNIFIIYMDSLRRAGKIELLPTYATFIDTARAEKVVGMMVADVVNTEEQRVLINLLGNNGVDVISVVLEAVNWALKQAGYLVTSEDDWIIRYKSTDEVKGEGWPQLRVSHEHAIKPITADEEKIIRAAEWFLAVDGNMRGFFYAMTQIYENLLLLGHWNAAIALTERIPYKTFMAVKTPVYYDGRVVDIMETTAQPNGDSYNGSAHTDGETNGLTNGARHEDMLNTVFRIKCRPYYEIMQLTLMLKALCDWRDAEDVFLSSIGDPTKQSHQARASLQAAFQDFCTIVEPVFNDFLTHTVEEDDVAKFQRLREAYLPNIVLAYNSALTFAGTYLGRANFIKALDLNCVLVKDENKELLQAMIDTKQMYMLTYTMGLTNLQLLRMNELAVRKEREDTFKTQGKGAKRRRTGANSWRTDEGKTFELWNFEQSKAIE